MSERQESPYDSIARRWLVLVERRQQNIIELCNTGRWRQYYTDAQFLEEMRKVLDLRNRWAQLAGLPASEQRDFEQKDFRQIEMAPVGVQSNIKQADRRNQNSAAHGAPVAKPAPQSAFGPRRWPASAILAAVAGRF